MAFTLRAKVLFLLLFCFAYRFAAHRPLSNQDLHVLGTGQLQHLRTFSGSPSKEDDKLQHSNFSARGSSHSPSKAPYSGLAQILPIGAGYCLNRHGLQLGLRELVPGVASCKERCLELTECTGFVVLRQSSCHIVSHEEPSDSNGDPSAQCFWKKTYQRDTRSYENAPIAIPPIIWAFWNNKNGATSPPAIVSLCEETWRQVNPGFKIRLLNETTMWDFLDRSDLPQSYEQLDMPHKSDSIRLALIAKYGGVYLDSSIMLLKPLTDLLGPDLTYRAFFTNNRAGGLYPERNRYETRCSSPRQKHEARVLDWVESWFIAAPPQDPLVMATKRCFDTYYEKQGHAYLLRDLRDVPGLFTQRQLDFFRAVDLDWRCNSTGDHLDGYLSLSACMIKAVDEDAAIGRLMQSNTTRIYDADEYAKRLFARNWWGGASTWVAPLLDEYHADMVADLSSDKSKLVKMCWPERDQVVGRKASQLWCQNNTLHGLMETLGIQDHSGICNASRP